MKICKRCEEKKDVYEFYKEPRNSDGLQSWCKKCHAEYKQDREKVFPDTEFFDTKEQRRMWQLAYGTYKMAPPPGMDTSDYVNLDKIKR